MPAYELNVILKRLPKAQLVECCQRIGEKLIDTGSILRRIEFLGHKDLLYTLRNPHVPRSPRFKQGSFFLYHFDTPAKNRFIIIDDLKLDYDIIHSKIHLKEPPLEGYDCTLEEELLTPALRPSVDRLIREGEWARKIKLN